MRRVASLSQEVLRVCGSGKEDIHRPAEASTKLFLKEQNSNPDAPSLELTSPGGQE